jgi:Ca-activated chloride channel family protein
MKYKGANISRLDAVKRLSRDFIFGNGRDLEGRPNDKVGLIAFAADPITLSPLTLSHGTLRSSIDTLTEARTVEDDGTAIGDAIALAAARLRVSVGTSGKKGKLIILITDGENNMGERTPEQAAALARQWGVKLYAITIRPESVDTKHDQEIEHAFAALAADTGGAARTVKDGDALAAIYREIDRLEPAHLDSLKRSDGDRALTWMLLAAFIILVGELALRETWLRKAPA